MIDVRTEVLRILAYRCEETARRWAADCPAASEISEQQQLAHINRHLFRMLSKLDVPCDRQISCLSGNYARTDHWLQDFANVIAPVIVANRRKLFAQRKRIYAMGSMDKLLSDQLANPMMA